MNNDELLVIYKRLMAEHKGYGNSAVITIQDIERMSGVIQEESKANE